MKLTIETTVRQDDIVTRWGCDNDDCEAAAGGDVQEVPLSNLTMVGNPLCPECEQEMSMFNFVGVALNFNLPG